jgi:CBS domain-containing protein
MASSSSPWQRFLRDLKIEDMLGAGPTEELKVDMLNRIIFLNKDETVKDAIDLLTQNKIISAPVYDDDANQFIGFVDMLDLATLCVEHLSTAKGKPLTQEEFERLPICSVIDLSGRNSWLPLDRAAPLGELFAALSKPDVHRVPIVDSKEREPEKKVLAIITQAEVIRWLWVSRSSPGFPTAALAMKIKDMSTAAVHEFAAQRELVLIEDNHTVIAALRKIVEKRVNGLGVVSESGELVGNVSATDVRVAAATGWQELTALLAKPLRDFLKFKASLMLTINERASHPRPITVTPEDKLETALEKLAVNHVHRVWVVRGEAAVAGTGAAARAEAEVEGFKLGANVPVGCVSLTDVIHELAEFNA